MFADRRRVVIVSAALTAFLAIGTFWLVRVVLGSTRAEFVAGTGVPSSTVVIPDPVVGSSAVPSTVHSPEGTTAETTAETTPGGTPGGGTPTTAASPPSGTPENSRTPEKSRTPESGTPTSSRPAPDPPVPTHAIRVGGALLDNDTPRTMCAVFTNTRLGATVTVTGVRVSGRLEIQPGGCAEDSNTGGRPPCERNLTLAPGNGCFAETVADTTTAGEYRGKVTLDLRVRCTSVATAACDVAVLRDDPPTSDRPAVLTWSDTGATTLCYRVPAADSEDSSPFCSSEPQPDS
ncbi:hypothetical protein [Actinoplanes rectilineatus]|uniref:hypothetical protein n=1 Tax=Actinoplanes rectilineatus TaxID=113571 RepID=UPI000B06404F|nr:hypothetical protein [Actinoplanes rectilineatus]